MKQIYAIYQCSREDFIKAAKNGVKLSSMPYCVNGMVVYCVKTKDEAFQDCVNWNSTNAKTFQSINWFAKVHIY